MSLKEYLTKIWLREKYAQIYLALYSMWSSPASSIARQAGYERVYTYKALQEMSDLWLLTHTKTWGTTHFWIPNTTLLQSYISKQRDQWTEHEQNFIEIKEEFETLREDHTPQAPRIQFFEWETQISNLFDDIKQTIIDQGLLTITFFGTHTFQEQVASPHRVGTYAKDFQTFIDDKNISITSHIAEWGLIMEQLNTYQEIAKISELPAGDNAINICLIGKIVYVIIYKWRPVWLKISSPELSWALWFLLKIKQ